MPIDLLSDLIDHFPVHFFFLTYLTYPLLTCCLRSNDTTTYFEVGSCSLISRGSHLLQHLPGYSLFCSIRLEPKSNPHFEFPATIPLGSNQIPMACITCKVSLECTRVHMGGENCRILRSWAVIDSPTLLLFSPGTNSFKLSVRLPTPAKLISFPRFANAFARKRLTIP